MIDENKILISHITDLIDSVKRGRRLAFTSFLSDEQYSVVNSILSKSKVNFSRFGGYSNASRAIVAISADDLPTAVLYPIDTLFFELKDNIDIGHRNVLGALMSLGVKRECIGDIVFNDGKCFVFVQSKMSDFICMNLTSISHFPIKLLKFEGSVEIEARYESLCCIVSSFRLDCFISEIANKSRNSATEIIESGFVFVDGVQCQKKDKIIDVGSTISIRKIGKFKIESLCGTTKKERFKLNILKYI